jgi:hypothetical protein
VITDDESFTRLYFFGTVLMNMEPERFWLTPLGLFLDLWSCYKQWHNIEKPDVEADIDSIIPCDC